IQRHRQNVCETKTFSPYDVLFGDAAIVQMQLRQHRSPGSKHSRDGPDRKSGIISFNQKGSRLTFALCEDKKQIGDLSETDPFLLPVQKIEVPETLRSRLNTLRITPDIWFGESVRADNLASCKPGKPALFQQLASPAQNRLRYHAMNRQQ